MIKGHDKLIPSWSHNHKNFWYIKIIMNFSVYLKGVLNKFAVHKSIFRVLFWSPMGTQWYLMGFGIVKLRVFQFYVLLKGALWTITLVASFYVTDKPPFNFFSSSPKTFFALWRLATNIIFKVLCFFLNYKRVTSRRPIFIHNSSLFCAICLNCIDRSEAVR